MSETLFRAIYISSATRSLIDEELASLLAVSRHNNAVWDITGVLCYYDRGFIQVLEGPKGFVEALLARIACDPRNTGMSIFEQEMIAKRTFGKWSMGWLRSSDLRQAGFDPKALFMRNATVNGILDAFRTTMRVPGSGAPL